MKKTINIAKDFMKNAKILQIEDNDMLNPNINHIYFICEQRDKIETLRKLFAALNLKELLYF